MLRFTRRFLLEIVYRSTLAGGFRGLFQSPGQNTAADPRRYAADIAHFQQDDMRVPPVRGGILFVGSSIFRLWTSLAAQMAPLPILNRAFGGSQTADQLYYMDTIVFPYAPKIILYYCGSNDINAGIPLETIFHNFQQFSERVQARLPETVLYFVSINRAPQKKAHWDIVDAVNHRIRTYCERTAKRGYVDVNPALFDAKGNVRTELFIADGLHLKPEAYVGFAAILRPVIEKTWNDLNARTHPTGARNE